MDEYENITSPWMLSVHPCQHTHLSPVPYAQFRAHTVPPVGSLNQQSQSPAQMQAKVSSTSFPIALVFQLATPIPQLGLLIFGMCKFPAPLLCFSNLKRIR